MIESIFLLSEKSRKLNIIIGDRKKIWWLFINICWQKKSETEKENDRKIVRKRR